MSDIKQTEILESLAKEDGLKALYDRLKPLYELMDKVRDAQADENVPREELLKLAEELEKKSKEIAVPQPRNINISED